ncbi:MAG: hypothetical protein ACOC2U_00580 [bacterium]
MMNNFDSIVNKHKYMFSLMNDKKRKYPIKFGFECGIGWYDILSDLFDKMAIIDTKKEISIMQIKEKFGTLRVYIKTFPSPSFIDKILLFISDIYNVTVRTLTKNFGIKWKFYKLYKHYIPKKQKQIRNLINEAEYLSSQTCEICGKKETAELLRINGWLSCLCQSCLNPAPLNNYD